MEGRKLFFFFLRKTLGGALHFLRILTKIRHILYAESVFLNFGRSE